MTGKIYGSDGFSDIHAAEDVAGDMARDLEEPCIVLQNLHTEEYWATTVESARRYLEDASSYAVASHQFYPEGGLRDDAPERDEYTAVRHSKTWRINRGAEGVLNLPGDLARSTVDAILAALSDAEKRTGK